MTDIDIVNEIEQELSDLGNKVPEAIAKLEAERAAIDDLIKRLRKVQAVTAPSQTKTRTAKPSTATTTTYTNELTKAITLKVAELIWAGSQNGDDSSFEFNPVKIKNELNLPPEDTKVYRALGALREFEFIARTRKEANQQFYKILDGHRIEDLRKLHAAQH